MDDQPSSHSSESTGSGKTSLRARFGASSFLGIAAALAGIGLISIFSDPSQTSRAEPESLLIPPEHLEHFVFGYREVAADVLWLRVVQDIDLCRPGVGALIVHSKEEAETLVNEKATGTGAAQPSRCRKGWTYHMLDAITELAPMFRAPYDRGGSALSILADDREGAKLLYEKAVVQFPEDWSIAMKAAYHYLIELNDPVRAAELLEQAGRNGAPPWVFSLAARLYSETGRAFLAKIILTDAMKLVEDEPESRNAMRLKQRLAEVEKILKTGSPPLGSSPDSK